MALTAEQLKTLTGTASGSAISQQGVSALTTTQDEKANERFSDGLFWDLLDTIGLIQAVPTAILSKKYTVSDALKRRDVLPSGALGIENPLAAFITDVALDPTWFLGAGAVSGGLKAIKAGKGAKTLAGAVKANQKTLLGWQVPFTEKSGSILRAVGLGKAEEKAAEGLTRLNQLVKGVPLGKESTIGTVLNKTFGTAPALRKGLSVDEMEAAASEMAATRNIVKTAAAAKEAARNTAMSLIEPVILKHGKKLSKLDEVKLLEQASLHIANKGVPKGLSKAAKAAYNDLAPILDELADTMKKLDIPGLENKILSNLPLDTIRQTGKFGVGSKTLDKTAPFEKFGTMSKINGQVHKTTLTSARNIVTGKRLINMDGDWIDAGMAGKVKALKNEEKATLGGLKRLQNKIDALPEKGSLGARAKLKRQITDQVDRIADIKQEAESLRLAPAKREMVTSRETNEALGTAAKNALLKKNPNATKAELDLAAKKAAVFKEDPWESIMATVASAGEYAAKNEAIEKIKKLPFVTNVAGMKADEIAAMGLEKVKIKGLEGFAATPEIRKAIEHVTYGYDSLGPLEGAIRGWHQATDFMKRISTYWNISFHSRNALSNHHTMSMAGLSPNAQVEGYKYLSSIMKWQKDGLRGKELIAKIAGKFGKDIADKYTEFIGLNLGGTGRYFGDIEQALKKRMWIDRVGGAIGNFLEDSAKFSMYLERRAKKFVPEAAATEVKKFLFDYRDLTDIEKLLFKGVMPFYTWTRKNIPLQLAMLIQKPGKVAILPKVKKAIEDMQEDEPMDESLLPPWMRNGFNVFLGQNPEGIQRFLNLQGFLPTVDLDRIGRPGEELLGMVNPLIKTPLELFSNYDFYLKKQIQEYEGQTDNLLGMEVNPYVSKFAGMFRPVNELARWTGLDQSESTMFDRAMRGLLGVNIRGFDPSKQQDIFDMLVGRNKSKLKSEIKKAQAKGDEEKQADLQELLKLVEQNTTL